MTVKELYDSIGGNYTGALELFMNEKIVLKFDTPLCFTFLYPKFRNRFF